MPTARAIGAALVATALAVTPISIANAAGSGSAFSGIDTGSLSTGMVSTGSLGSAAGTPFRRVARPDSGARLVKSEDLDGDPQVKQLWIDSPAFGRVMRIGILLPEDRSEPRPSIQMLDGLQGWQGPGDESLPGGAAWLTAGGGRDFFRDKNVNVVLSVNGGPTYYRDWAERHPEQGTIAWDTFLATEVPQIVDEQFEGNGVWGVAGLSMGAHAAFMQMTRHPDVYSTVGGFSGCYDTSDEFGRAQIRGVVSGSGITPDQIFGGPDDPRWTANDPWLHPESFRGKTVWMSAASGKPGVSDWDAVMKDESSSTGGSAAGIPGVGDALADVPALDPIVAGGPYEAIAMNCTRRFEKFLAQQGVPSTTLYEDTGVHNWALWKAQLPKAWPTLAAGLGVTD